MKKLLLVLFISISINAVSQDTTTTRINLTKSFELIGLTAEETKQAKSVISQFKKDIKSIVSSNVSDEEKSKKIKEAAKNRKKFLKLVMREKYEKWLMLRRKQQQEEDLNNIKN